MWWISEAVTPVKHIMLWKLKQSGLCNEVSPCISNITSVLSPVKVRAGRALWWCFCSELQDTQKHIRGFMLRNSFCVTYRRSTSERQLSQKPRVKLNMCACVFVFKIQATYVFFSSLIMDTPKYVNVPLKATHFVMCSECPWMHRSIFSLQEVT